MLPLSYKIPFYPLTLQTNDYPFLSPIKTHSGKSSYLRALHGWTQHFLSQITHQVSCLAVAEVQRSSYTHINLC